LNLDEAILYRDESERHEFSARNAVNNALMTPFLGKDHRIKIIPLLLLAIDSHVVAIEMFQRLNLEGMAEEWRISEVQRMEESLAAMRLELSKWQQEEGP